MARGSVDDQPVLVVCEVINDQIVDHAAIRIQHAGVQRLAEVLEPVDVVGDQVAQELPNLPATEVDHGHVRNIEYAGIRAYGVMLLLLGAIVQRHVPAAEIDDAGIRGHVLIVKRRS